MGLLGLVPQGPGASRDVGFWLDAASGVLTVAAIWGGALPLGPYLWDAAFPELEGWTLALLYPLFDLTLLLVVLVGLAGRGWRADRTITHVGRGFLPRSPSADMIYAWHLTEGLSVSPPLLETRPGPLGHCSWPCCLADRRGTARMGARRPGHRCCLRALQRFCADACLRAGYLGADRGRSRRAPAGLRQPSSPRLCGA